MFLHPFTVREERESKLQQNPLTEHQKREELPPDTPVVASRHVARDGARCARFLAVAGTSLGGHSVVNGPLRRHTERSIGPLKLRSEYRACCRRLNRFCGSNAPRQTLSSSPWSCFKATSPILVTFAPVSWAARTLCRQTDPVRRRSNAERTVCCEPSRRVFLAAAWPLLCDVVGPCRVF